MKQIILLILASNLSLYTFGDSKDDGETRTATVSYEVSPEDVINVQSKYTHLIVETWDKDEVEVTATVRFDGRITNRMQEFLDAFEDEVKRNITKTPSELLIKTSLDEPNKFQLGSRHVGIVISFNEDELKLEYALKVPSGNELQIKNSYRDVVMNGSYKEVIIDQYSGDLKVETIEKADITLKYGSARFDTIEDAEMELYEQEITASRIGKLEIDTKYSELKITELGKLEATSYETDYELGSMVSIEGNYKYGKMEISDRLDGGQLTTYEFDIEAGDVGELKFDESKYGSLEATYIEMLDLSESYEDDFDLGFVGTLVAESKYGNYEIDRLGSKFDLYGYEDEIDIGQIDEGASEIFISGKYVETTLDISGRPYKIMANTKYGDINIDRDSMNVRKYIKDGDLLEIEASYGEDQGIPVLITIKGYEMDLDLD